MTALSYEDRRQPSALEESTFTERALLERIALCRRELNRSSDELKMSTSLVKVRAHHSPHSRATAAPVSGAPKSIIGRMHSASMKGPFASLPEKPKVESDSTRSSSMAASTDQPPSSKNRIESAKARLEKAKEAQAALLMKAKSSRSVDSDSEKSVASTIKRAMPHRNGKEQAPVQKPSSGSGGSLAKVGEVPHAHQYTSSLGWMAGQPNGSSSERDSALPSTEVDNSYTFHSPPDLLDPSQFNRYLYSHIPTPLTSKPMLHARSHPDSLGNTCNIFTSYNQIVSVLNGPRLPTGYLQ
jgi:hypothetical protein